MALCWAAEFSYTPGRSLQYGVSCPSDPRERPPDGRAPSTGPGLYPSPDFTVVCIFSTEQSSKGA